MTKTLTEQQIRKIIENGTEKAAKVCKKKFYGKPKSLTEQWREGKLPDGYYYVNGKWINYYSKDDGYFNDGGVEEVLAPVPSYEEYNELLRHSELSRNLVYEVLVNQKEYNELLDKAKEYKRLQERLTIATKALKEYADDGNWDDIRSYNFYIDDTYFVEKAEFREKGYEPAKKALKEMEGVK